MDTVYVEVDLIVSDEQVEVPLDIDEELDVL
jgi:hypothetical protein